MFFYLFLVLFAFSEASEKCELKNSVDISNGTVFRDGSIVHKGITYPPEYVISQNVSGEVRTFGCVCKLKHCIRKCCAPGSVMFINETKKGCSEMLENDIITNYGLNLSYYQSFKKNVLLFESGFGLLHGRPCPNVYVEDDAKWFLQEDGKLFIMISGNIPPWLILGPENYCIDTFVHEDSSGERTTQLDALICFAEKQEENHYVLSFTCMIISCVFILATCAVYAWLPELRNLHGRVLMAYLLCLFVAFAFMATMQIMLTIDNISSNACAVLTFIIYYWLLVAFFWLNVMCFDIWWTFSGKRGMSLEKLSIRARFLAYSAYAFSIPTALTILLAALEFSGLPSHPLLPMIRQQGCFIYGTSKLIYLYGPIVVLCVANLIFFVLTAVKITQIKRQTSVLKSKESSMHDQHRNDKQRFLLYVKLFAVMGINWILEVLSAIYPDPNEFWRFTDAYNVLIGVIIFIIFVCKRKIFRLIKKRIKETYHRSTNDEEMKRFGNTKRNGQRTFNQTSRSDTIRTTVGIDTNSIKSSTQL
ncbi:G-protein coupled receptor Mth2-like isoform X2 [Manduca sexta]|uniref:G-protein coupled receptor Mth2-like isoform X2 n=1 Tax=Manduca sexta TaxID=7130 RepID=UPI00188F72C0|nr:G-protein coupled receptor Mth2-like isoform X2 [Manduca sexta]